MIYGLVHRRIDIRVRSGNVVGQRTVDKKCLRPEYNGVAFIYQCFTVECDRIVGVGRLVIDLRRYRCRA